MKKVLSILILFVIALSLLGCGESGYDETHHYNLNMFGSKVDLEEHIFNVWSSEKSATCTEKGEEYSKCEKCEYVAKRDTSALGHNYGEVSYTWNKDYSRVEAKRVCLNDASHIEVETVKTTYKIIKEATKEDFGAGLYTSYEFKNKAFVVQTHEVVLPKLGDEPIVDKELVDISISSLKESYLLDDDLNENIDVVFTPSDAKDKTVNWKSSDESIVGINEEGMPYIKGAGSVSLTCYSVQNDLIFDTVDIVIKNYVTPTSFKIQDKNNNEITKISIEIEEKFNINILPEPLNGDPEVTYTVSDSKVVKVDENGLVSPVEVGTCTITVTSVSNPELSKTIEVEIYDYTCTLPVTSVKVDGEKELYVGYETQLTARVYPLGCNHSVTWEVHTSSKDKATIDKNGVVKALKEGIFRVRAVCVQDPTIKSAYFSISITTFPEPIVINDMKGYQIVIMTDADDMENIDPFREGYKNPDKMFKQRAWNEVEENYNCKLVVKNYPETASWGQNRINWIIDNAMNGTTVCDLAMVSSNWIYQFANANAAVDVSELYGKYDLSQMEPVLKTASSYKGKLYSPSTGISRTETFVESGLFYNYGWIKELELESPAKMFNEGRWTYTDFVEWVTKAQAKLDKNEYVLGGHPYYYWQGMTNAAGQVIANTESSKVYITSSKSVDATSLIYSLVKKGCVNTNPTWAESNDVPSSFWRTNGGTLMTTGKLANVKNSEIWTDEMWGEGTTEFGYVPFPYPDDMKKDDTRVSISEAIVYMYVAGKQYPPYLGSDAINKIWTIMNEMFLNTVKYQENDPLYFPEEIIWEKYNKYFADRESSKAIAYYNGRRAIYDPTYYLQNAPHINSLVEPTINTMFKGMDYMEEFNKVFKEVNDKFYKVYSE